MNNKLKKKIIGIEFLSKLSPIERKKYLKFNAKKDVIQFLIDIIYNVNNGTIKINDTLVEALSPLKNKIKSICLKKKSLKKRKLELINGNLYDKIIIKILPFIIRN